MQIEVVKLGENHVFYLGDVLECLDLIQNNSIDLVFTSPPYNVGKQYENHNDSMPYEEYLRWLEEVFKKVYLKLKDDGRFVLNVAVISKNGEVFPIHSDCLNICRKIGFKFRSDIIWYKGRYVKILKWGSFCSPSNPGMINPYEYILVFNKKYKKHVGKKENIDITKEEFINFCHGLWEIRPETRKKILEVCPAPFPEELAYRVIKYYTYIGDVVLDIFGGSGTTSKVAAELKRKSIYIDNSKKTFDFAIERVKSVLKMLK